MALTALTSEQEVVLEEVRFEWMSFAITTEPGLGSAAEEGLALAYAAAGRRPFRTVIWFESPLAAGLAAAVLVAFRDDPRSCSSSVVSGKVLGDARTRANEAFGEQISEAVLELVRPGEVDQRTKVRYPWLGHQFVGVGQRLQDIRAAVGNHVHRQCIAQMGTASQHVWVEDGNLVDESMQAQVLEGVNQVIEVGSWEEVLARFREESLLPQMRGIPDNEATAAWDRSRARYVSGAYADWGYGQHDADWLGFYDFFHKIGRRGLSHLTGLWQLSKSSGWWWGFDDVALLVDRPYLMSFDDEGRLHSDTGPAIAFRDGFRVYSLHGSPVNEDVVAGRTP